MRGPRPPVFATLLIVLSLLADRAEAVRGVEFLYVNAGEGSASGGHAAIKFDDEVFHFQHVESGLLRIFRDDFSAFRFNYGDRENRVIFGHRLAVDNDVAQTLREAFNRRWIVQNQQFSELADLRRDRALLTALGQASTDGKRPSTELKALGYFVDHYRVEAALSAETSHHADAPSLTRLRNALIECHGQDWLRDRREQLGRQLLGLIPPSTEIAVEVVDDRLFASEPTFARRYQSLLLNIAAIDLLAAGAIPRDEVLIGADQLNADAVAKLAEFRRSLFEQLIDLPDSRRDDWGYPLLVGMARLQALDQSIATGRLTVIKRLQPRIAGASGGLSFPADRLAGLAAFAREALAKALAMPEPLNEQSYGALEIAADTVREIEAAIEGNRDWVLPDTHGSPALPAAAELVPLPLANDTLTWAENVAEARLERYEQALRRLYAYHLLQRNCVTELFRVVDQALGPDQAKLLERAEGPASWSLSPIPFVAFDWVGSHYRLQNSYVLKPYRDRQIERRYRVEPSVLIDLQESNVLSSSVYQWHAGDAAFAFFTQDAVWPRPFQGSVNLAVALGQTVYGLLAWPWTDATALQQGLTGIAVSAPELLFFNIRKGSFPRLLPVTGGDSDFAP